ncbi:hypothetical protein ACIQUL_29420 [Streptomyces sp. NPDC090303]|uniref:hypothetical protein n=1 Tax=Streptomyces sp. NPDC090303 TaxID=3365960 RepID=UPI00382FD4B1
MREHSFEYLLRLATARARTAYPGAMFVGAHGTEPYDAGRYTGALMGAWRFVYRGAQGETVLVRSRFGTLDVPRAEREAWFFDRSFEPADITLTLNEAAEIARGRVAVRNCPTIVLRWPLGPLTLQPYYIFTQLDGRHAFVGTRVSSLQGEF